MTVRGAAKGSYSRYNQKYNIGFINSDGMEDETQFESVKTLKELSDLFRDFCKENGLKTNTVGGNMKMSDYVREWAEAFKEPDPDPIEEKAMQILETAKPVPIQIPERLFDKERIKELEKDLIRAEAERDVFQKLYKEQLAIS